MQFIIDKGVCFPVSAPKQLLFLCEKLLQKLAIHLVHSVSNPLSSGVSTL